MRDDDNTISFAFVTNAASRRGLQIARAAADFGADLLLVSEAPDILDAAEELRATGVQVVALQADASPLSPVVESMLDQDFAPPAKRRSRR